MFAVQTDVAKRIAEGALKIKSAIENNAVSTSDRKCIPIPMSVQSRGRSSLFGPGSSWSPERPREAKREFEKAISIDPTNARAYSGLSDALGLDWDMSGGEDAWVALRRDTARAHPVERQLGLAHLFASDDFRA